MLRACEDIDLSLDRHGLGGKHGIETEGSAMQFPAGQAVADSDSIGLSPRLEADLAAGAAAFMHAARHFVLSSIQPLRRLVYVETAGIEAGIFCGSAAWPRSARAKSISYLFRQANSTHSG